MTFGVIVFPGSNCDRDTLFAIEHAVGMEARPIWHSDETLHGVDCVVLPGGFAYGDYLRAGAIARFAPVMGAVRRHAVDGGLVLGICNGFQVLVEAGLLPGALLRNRELEFRCEWVHLRVEQASTPFTAEYRGGETIRMPVAHGEGRYYADAETLDQLESNGQVILRYCDGPDAPVPYNPNGSARDIAGIVNARRNVCGLMPHPERCCDPLLGGVDGLRLFQSLVAQAVAV